MKLVEAPALKRFLRETDTSDLLKLKGHNVIEVTIDDTLASTLKTLSEHNLLSVPVGDGRGNYVGFVDVFDIITKLLMTYPDSCPNPATKWSEDWASWFDQLDLFTQKGSEFGSIPVSEAINFSGLNRWNPLPPCKLDRLIETFAAGIHRVPIVVGRKIEGILSQSDIVLMLNKPIREELLLLEIEDLPVKDLYLTHTEPVVTVNINCQAIMAFWSMFTSKVNAVAVIDNDGYLVGNMSASDIKGIGGPARQFGALLLPIGEYSQIQGPGKFKPIITCTSDITLGKVVGMLAESRIHRIWVVEEEKSKIKAAGKEEEKVGMKPVGMISLTDVMKLLTRLAENPA